ncbi:MAG: HAMP domain-containing histidine kinase [Gammaproteobacteria bacterium]|nr:HAMP domain-containing histidine kinase [Gammaproteobacteria bacterium]
MNLIREPVKALQIGFLVLLIISAATVAWWIFDHVTYERDLRDRLAMLYDADAQAVTAAYGGAEERFAELLPHLSIESGLATVRVEAIDALEEEAASRINRYIWEGGFFLLVLIGGMGVLTRTIRRDADLRKRQQNFLAAVSHEFKSPLASMRLSAETLLLRAQDPDTQRLGQRVLEDGERLLRMVDNLLDTTRLEEGRHALEREPVTLREVIVHCVEEIAERARHNSITVEANVAEDCVLDADRTALETVLRNLLDNAVKACVAGEGSAINIEAVRADGSVTITVRDNGLGFPPEHGAQIFKKFYRLGDELRRTTPGTGLGLYIVKRLVDLSDATIAASSEGPGRGATVTVSWPEAKAP